MVCKVTTLTHELRNDSVSKRMEYNPDFRKRYIQSCLMTLPNREKWKRTCGRKILDNQIPFLLCITLAVLAGKKKKVIQAWAVLVRDSYQKYTCMGMELLHTAFDNSPFPLVYISYTYKVFCRLGYNIRTQFKCDPSDILTTHLHIKIDYTKEESQHHVRTMHRNFRPMMKRFFPLFRKSTKQRLLDCQQSNAMRTLGVASHHRNGRP